VRLQGNRADCRASRAVSPLKCTTCRIIGCGMEQVDDHLSGEERRFIQRHLNEGRSCHCIGLCPRRSAPTISHKIKRSSGAAHSDHALAAASSCRARHRRGLVKLRERTMPRQCVLKHGCPAWSPPQISGKLKAMNCRAAKGVDKDAGATDPALPGVSHETIRRAITGSHAVICART
jgi:IS30 family transposase